ncbi:MAG: low molecular weight phosphotyrosine protein phosphatase [Candidatus Polarisedimenticolaceae bacterium]|nr:low molecular weight phosphotyrosine protein phosphatase [Candidatus Polarisedimenticolaceae bacterium]
MKKISVLFCCMGNICRSPTAEGVFQAMLDERGLAEQVEVDSAGTHGHYHAGEPPDRRAREQAKEKGVDLSGYSARRIHIDDFSRFDYLLAMDLDNYNGMMTICPEEYKSRVHLFLDFAPELEIREVPDPYYGGPAGFERVYQMIEQAAGKLLDEIAVKLAE